MNGWSYIAPEALNRGSLGIFQLLQFSIILNWIVNELKYPLLSPLAHDLLSAAASEAFVKRVLSVCGELTAGRRDRLTKGLKKRTLLKMNRKYYR